MTDIYAQIQSAANAGAFGVNGYALPTVEQCRAGNYRKGRVTLYGLNIAIETPQGQRRMGKADGKPWSVICMAHYGDISGTRGADGDPVDCYIGPTPESNRVFVVNQNGKDGAFDEHKVMLAFADEDAARSAYMGSYERGWTGLGSMVSATVDQFRWWLKYGDTRKPFTKNALPYDGEDDMNEITWDSAGMPANSDLATIIYGLRCGDADGLLLDAVQMSDIMEDADSVDVLDALVVENAKLQIKMEQLQRIMEAAGDSVKPVALQISEPFKQKGTTNVTALFELSDGQTVAIFFHNPDSTPNKILPQDELVSWKWLLNKKDVTILVAPEKGRDLNPREVARRVMKLAERNSAKFQKANTARAERLAGIEQSKTEVAAKESALAALDAEIADLSARVEAKRAKQAPSPGSLGLSATDLATGAGSVEPEHYSAQVLTALVDHHGWARSAEGFVSKNVGGATVGGELNPTGERLVSATFDASGRYLALQFGFKDVFDIDCRDRDPLEAAAEFNAKVNEWAGSTGESFLDVARRLVPAEFESRDDAEGFTAIAADGYGIRFRLTAGGKMLGAYIIKPGVNAQESMGSSTLAGGVESAISVAVDTALLFIQKWRAERKIDWTKAEELATNEAVRALGVARVHEIGSENVYVEKGGMPFFFKPGNTDAYEVGEHDFAQDETFAVAPEPSASLPAASVDSLGAALAALGWVEEEPGAWSKGDYIAAAGDSAVTISHGTGGVRSEAGIVSLAGTAEAIAAKIDAHVPVEFEPIKDGAPTAEEQAEADEQAKYQPFDRSKVKMPSAVQLLLNQKDYPIIVSYDGKDGWSNGHILALSKPKLVTDAIAKYHVDEQNLRKLGQDAVSRVIPKDAKVRLEPIADYEDSYTDTKSLGKAARGAMNGSTSSKDIKKVSFKAIIMVNQEAGVGVQVDARYFGYFDKTYKQPDYYVAASGQGAVLVKKAGEIVGVMMPMRSASDALKRAVKAAGLDGEVAPVADGWETNGEAGTLRKDTLTKEELGKVYVLTVGGQYGSGYWQIEADGKFVQASPGSDTQSSFVQLRAKGERMFYQYLQSEHDRVKHENEAPQRRADWQTAVTEALADSLEIPYGDADGVLTAHGDLLDEQYAKGTAAEDVAKMIEKHEVNGGLDVDDPNLGRSWTNGFGETITIESARDGKYYTLLNGKVGGAPIIPVADLEKTIELDERQYQERLIREQAAQQEDEAKAALTAAKEAEYADIGGPEGESAMARGRRVKALSSLIRVNGEIKTSKKMVEDLVAAGATTSSYEEDRIKPMSRTAFNRASQAEQDAHARKVAAGGKVTTYQLGDHVIDKTAFDYANYLIGKQQAGTPAGDEQEQAARELLQSVIDGSADMDEGLADRLQAVHEQYESNAEIMALFEQAANAFSDAMIAKAKAALAA